jgi:hypothetical protein
LEILAQRDGQAWVRVKIEDRLGVVEATDRYSPSAAGTLDFLLPSESSSISLFHARGCGRTAQSTRSRDQLAT